MPGRRVPGLFRLLMTLTLAAPGAGAVADTTCDLLQPGSRAQHYARFDVIEGRFFDAVERFPSASDTQGWPAGAQQSWLALLRAVRDAFDDHTVSASDRDGSTVRDRLEALFKLSEQRWGRAPGTVRRPLTQALAGAALASRRPHEQPVSPLGITRTALTWPVPRVRVNSPFGVRQDPLRANRREFHAGVDLAGRRGEPVNAAGRGRVILSGKRGGLGLAVGVRHPTGLVSVYGHLNDVFVEVGDLVGPRDPIGTIGTSGRSTGPHLHFAIRCGEAFLDPVCVLAKPTSAASLWTCATNTLRLAAIEQNGSPSP